MLLRYSALGIKVSGFRFRDYLDKPEPVNSQVIKNTRIIYLRTRFSLKTRFSGFGLSAKRVEDAPLVSGLRPHEHTQSTVAKPSRLNRRARPPNARQDKESL